MLHPQYAAGTSFFGHRLVNRRIHFCELLLPKPVLCDAPGNNCEKTE
jgi:hypothetical protein